MSKIEYNNSLFSPKGKLNRLFYALHNAFWFLVGFRYIYYPSLLMAIQSSPDFPQLISLLSSSPQLKGLVPYLSSNFGTSFIDISLKYLFILILRIVDIKRIRDLVNRNLTMPENIAVVGILSLPYIDFLSTVVLVLMPSNKFAKNELHAEIKKKDLHDARVEKTQAINQKLFEQGKISRAEFEKNRKS